MKHLLLSTALLVGPTLAVSAQNHPRPSLGQLLDDARGSDARKKTAAIQQLRSHRPESSADIQLLVQGAHSGDARLKEAASESLSHIALERTDLKDPVIALLDDKEPRIQLAAVRGCRLWNAKETVPKLRKMLLKAPRFRIKKYDAGGITPEVQELHMELASALAQFKDFEAADEILSREELMSQDAFGGPLIAQFGAQMLPKAVALARKGDIRKGGATFAISYMRDEAAIPQLVQLLDDPDDHIASAAARALGEISPQSSENKRMRDDGLDKAMTSKNEHVRAHAYAARIARKNPAESSITLETIRKERGPARLEIFYALMKNDRKEAVPVLKEFIKENERDHPNPYDTTDRKVAAQAIFRLTGERVPYLGVENDRQQYKDPYDPEKH